MGGSTWTDLGNDILINGYVGTIVSGYGNPLGGRPGWVDDQTEWQQVVVDLSAYAGKDAQFRWRFGADVSVGDTGWFIDDVEITESGSSVGTMLISDVEVNGNTLMISGENFTGNAYVRVDDTWLFDVTVVNSAEIRAALPYGVINGAYQATVYNGDCQSVTVSDSHFIIYLPNISK